MAPFHTPLFLMLCLRILLARPAERLISTVITGLSNGQSYTYYVNCVSTLNNTSSNYTVSFSVAQASNGGGGGGGGGGPPTVTKALTVVKTGTGDATISSNLFGIYCGTLGVNGFTAGSSVILSATPLTGSYIASWTGCSSSLKMVLVLLIFPVRLQLRCLF